MRNYSYTFVSAEIPAIPLILIQLKTPESTLPIDIEAQGILDTGSDCTLVPIPFLTQVKARPSRGSVRIPVGGKLTLGIPYEVGLILAQYSYPKFQVFGCPVDEIGELLIIGRDLMNQHCLQFDGKNLTFTIF